MKKCEIDYRKFRFSKLKEPEFSHLWLLLSWVFFFIFYFITENLIPVEKCHVIHCALDDLIPFCEWFVIPYVLWYLLIFLSLGYFLLYNVKSFKKLQSYIFITQIVAMIIYIAYPNCQNLRPSEFARDNFLTNIVASLYSLDTNTGVLPSLHCAYSIGIATVWLKEKNSHPIFKAFIIVFAFTICLSTMFIKQHSALDFLAAIPLCILAEFLVYKVFYKKKNET